MRTPDSCTVSRRGSHSDGLCATAFRSPSLEERYDFIDLGTYVRLGNPDLHAEQSLSLNAGIRITIDDLHIRGDAFLNGLTDMVAELPGDVRRAESVHQGEHRESTAVRI